MSGDELAAIIARAKLTPSKIRYLVLYPVLVIAIPVVLLIFCFLPGCFDRTLSR